MSIRILIDMNLAPDWADELAARGWTSVHWSTVGDPRAADQEIMQWARANGSRRSQVKGPRPAHLTPSLSARGKLDKPASLSLLRQVFACLQKS